MSCNHPKIWEVLSFAIGSDDGKRLLNEGWEPFAAIPETEYSYEKVFFRRAKDCEKCKGLSEAMFGK